MKVVEGVRLTESDQDVIAEVSRLRGSGVDVGYDLETTSLDPFVDKMVAVVFKPRGKQATIIDVRQFDADQLLNLGTALEPLFDGAVTLVGQNLKFDLEWAWIQMKLAGHKAYDMQLAEQVILGLGWSSAEKKGIHFSMLDIAKRYGIPVEKEARNYFIHLDQRPLEWAAPFPDEQVRYMRQDVSVPHKVHSAQQLLIDQYGLAEVIDIEMRALFPLVGIEYWGVEIGKVGWLSVIERIKAVADDLERKLHLGMDGEPGGPDQGYDGLDIHVLKVRNERHWEKWHPYHDWLLARDAHVATEKLAYESDPTYDEPRAIYKNWSEYKKVVLEDWYERHGRQTKPPETKGGINLGSWKQVRDGFNDLGIPVESVNEETLTPYIGKHSLVQVYIDYQHARKIVTVYGPERGRKKQSFIERLDSGNRLRASYQQLGTDTGRYSSNFQQIPSDGIGADLRKHIVAAAGHIFLVADFSNIELRILAELSGDPVLLSAFASGQDVHTTTAALMFGLTPEQSTKEWADNHNAVVGGKELVNTSYRKIAKTINYMLLYGAGPKRLAIMLHIEESVSKTLMQTYYKTFAIAIAYLNKLKSQVDKAMEQGRKRVYSVTKAGRRRWFDLPSAPVAPDHRMSVEEYDKWQGDMDAWRGALAGIKRQMANSPIQGLSADITKLMSALWYEEVGYTDACRLVALIHDEGIVEVADPDGVMFDGQTHAGYAARLLEGCMQEAMHTYLHKVDCGQVKAVRTPFWSH